jgi:hypothetical protein
MTAEKMYLTVVLLKDAYTCLNGSNTSEFFSLSHPPTLEHWTARGPMEVEVDMDVHSIADDDEFQEYFDVDERRLKSS